MKSPKKTRIADVPRPRRQGKLRTFWEQLTDRKDMEELWHQLRVDAKESYGLYSSDVNWEKVKQSRGPKRYFLAAWALLQTMLAKLTPPRRVLLVMALVFLIIHPQLSTSDKNMELDLTGLSALILFVLLALELADRVTMKRDLEIARDIQRFLVPAAPPTVAGTDMAFATRPMNTVAGDYYDALVRKSFVNGMERSRLLFTVADVAGKSVPAALLMATFQASLQTLAARGDSLDGIVEGLNRYACAHSLGGLRFTTAFVAELDMESLEMRYYNAGHNAPILLRASGAIERLEAGGVPFGIFTATSYETSTAQLATGDRLIIFTDGVVEAENEDHEEFGEPRLLDIAHHLRTETAEEMLGRIMGAVDKFVGPARQHDDITCFVLRIA